MFFYVGLNYFNLNDLYGITENGVLVDAKLSRYLNKEFIQLEASVDYDANKYIMSYNGEKIDTSTSSSSIIYLNPSVSTYGKKYEFTIGLEASVEANIVTRYLFFPTVDFSYNFIGNYLIAYCGIGGKIIRNSFETMTRENPFLSTYADIRNSSYSPMFSRSEEHTSELQSH